MKHLIISSILFAISSPAYAQVDKRIHDRCLSATDYKGCVELQRGNADSIFKKWFPSSTNPKVERGNKCEGGYAYVGKGLCQKVICVQTADPWNPKGNDPLIAGKSDWSCPAGPWRGFLFGGNRRGELRLGAADKLKFDSDCPKGPPRIGWNSTCETGGAR